jgi:hypothetical protein
MIPAWMRSEPLDGAPAVSQLLPGEGFAVLDIKAGWAWGYSTLDHRVGYVEAIDLADPRVPTHLVIEPTAPIQPAPDPLSPPLSYLPMGSRLHGDIRGALLEFEAGFVPLSYLRAIDEPAADPVAVATRLMGSPYEPGGRTCQGIDCAGLVQLSLQLCGVDCPRDARDQRALGRALAEDASLRRGDLLFCEDHVGMMVDEIMAVQVSLTTHKVTVEPFGCARPAGSAEGLERRRLDL